MEVSVSCGRSIITGLALVGVQEGTMVKRGVTVNVGGTGDGYNVGGGNGLRLLLGSTKIKKK
jgi:hypothetical protein